MKIALIADQHFGVRNDNPVFLNNQKKFYENIFFPTLKEEGCKNIIDLGDSFDKRKAVDFRTLSEAKEMYFDPCKEYSLYSIVGNHNTYYKNTNDINSCELLLSQYDNVTLVEDEPMEIDFGGVSFILCPWICKENYEKCMSALSDTNASFLLGHFEINGFEMSKGFLCKSGFDKELFSSFEQVYSGHFHIPSKKGNIEYLGAPYQMDWNDYGGKRGFYIFDTETRDKVFHENPYHLFHKIEYYDLPIDEIAHLDFSPLEGCYASLVVNERESMESFEAFVNAIENANPADLKVIENVKSLKFEPSENLEDVKETQDVVDHYVDSVEISKVPKDKVKSLIKELYNEAQTL